MLTSIFAQFGSPRKLVFDSGSQLTSKNVEAFCNLNGIEHIKTAPYTNMSNSQSERFVDTFKRAMRKMEKKKKH